MRSTIAVAVIFAAALPGVAAAQETLPSIDPTLPGVATPPAEAPEAEAPKADLPKPQRIDALLDTLKTTKDEREGKRAEVALLRLWLESGSDTVDLLMSWSLKAVEAKNYALALDFLDRITLMKPDYVEGWNKRATVHFLLDDYGRSLSDIARALEIEPRHFGALSGLGAILRSVGEDDKAIVAYRQALELDPYLDAVKEALEELEKKAEGENT